MRAFVVNSFGKTVRARQSQLAITVVNGTDRMKIGFFIYNSRTGRIVTMRRTFGAFGAFDATEISLTSIVNDTTTISFSPVYAGMQLVNANILL